MNLKDMYAKLKYYDDAVNTNNKSMASLMVRKNKSELSPEEMHLLRSLQDANRALEDSKRQILAQYGSHIGQMSVL